MMDLTKHAGDQPLFHIDYRDKVSLARLAMELDGLNGREARLLWVQIMDAGLMNWPLTILLPVKAHQFLAKLSGNRVDQSTALLRLIGNPRLERVFATLWRQTIDWMQNGTDRFDKASAGGWSSKEMMTFLEMYRPFRTAGAN